MAKIKAETLLRKIQKQGGKIVNRVKPGGYNFNFDTDRVQIFKKREIVRPYLHSIDSRIIGEQVDQSVSNKFRSTDPKLQENLKKFLPNHLINDIYSMYYNRPGRLEFEGLSKTNKVKFDILDSINNSLIKVVTNGSHIGSYVYTEEIGKYLYEKFMTLPEEKQKQLQKAMEGCNQGDDESDGKQGQAPGQKSGPGEGKGTNKNDPNAKNEAGQGSVDGNGEDGGNYETGDSGQGMANNSNGESTKRDNSQSSVDKMLDGLLNSKKAKADLEKAFQAAQDKLEKLKDVGVDYEGCEDMPEDEKNEIIANLNNLDAIKRELSGLAVSKDKVLKAVEKILNGTTNYFSKKCITNDVELFEAEQLLDINGLEFLHPIFRNSRLFDMSITERKYIGKFDLYIDCSGSMSSGCGGDMSSVQRITLAKSLAMQMKELGILGDLYEFEDRPKKINNTDISILMMRASGGTDIEKVLKNILNTGNNSVVLTDGESHIETYTHQAFFIGVGTDFSYFGNDKNAGEKLVKNGQCVAYNGKEFEVATGARTPIGRGW